MWADGETTLVRGYFSGRDAAPVKSGVQARKATGLLSGFRQPERSCDGCIDVDVIVPGFVRAVRVPLNGTTILNGTLPFAHIFALALSARAVGGPL